MPDEPTKPIEELLQASAKTRRAEFGADPKMPNPMRTRLHDEIARATREAAPEVRRRWNWFAISWPIGTVAAAVLVVAFVMSRSHEFRSPNESRQVATNQPARSESAMQPAAPQVAAKALQKKSNERQRFADLPAEPKTQAPPIVSQPGSSASVAASSSTFFAQTESAQGSINQQFSRNAARSAKFKQSANVLNKFQIQQSGDRIRVVDADGSTYTGKIEQVGAVHRTAPGSAAQDAISQALKDEKENLAARSERDLSQQNNSQFYFRATGYNNSLQKAIVFEGTYIAAPSQAQKPNETTGANKQQSPARIVGTAKAPDEPPVEVDATSIPQ